MKMKHFLRDNGKKLMAIFSAILMITFFLPNLRGTSGGSSAASHAVATIFDGTQITAQEEATLRQEWDLLRHHLYYVNNPADQQGQYLASLLGAQQIGYAIDTNPNAFMLLVEEARHLGIAVSGDQLQELLHGHLPTMPDEDDAGYDLARQAVYDFLLVHNLLDRVGDAVKLSQPAQARLLALTQQDVAVSLAKLSAKRHLADATQPTDEQIAAQYNQYRALLPDKITADNPLGFGYCLPDRIKLQYIGFHTADLRDHVKASRPSIEWQTLARRLYRTHSSDFPVPTTAPTTQTLILGYTPWENLPPDVAERVFNQVYDTATADLQKKVMEWMTDQFASDYAVYRDAMNRGQPSPLMSNGATFDSDDYIRRFAGALHDQFGVLPVLGLINNGWKSADDLTQLVDIAPFQGIGKAATEKGQPFPEYATTAGDQFAAAAALDPTDRLAAWQPSAPVYVGGAASPTEFYFFRITAMDASHPMSLDEARDSVAGDLRIQQAWKLTLAEADTLLASAREAGLQAALKDVTPAPSIVSTGLFNVSQAKVSGQIAGLVMLPDQVKDLAQGVMDLMSQQAAGQHPMTLVRFPADRTVALVELTRIQASWPDIGERMRRQSEVSSTVISQEAAQLETAWSLFDESSKRTSFKEIK
jgi:hypothetical protein